MGHGLNRRPGFSLVELLTVLGLGLSLVAGLLSLFRVHAAVAHRQSQAADLQQSLRIARHELARFCRAAGRGGLSGGAVEVRNNLAPGSKIGGAGTAGVVAGTDVLVVRGVFAGAMLEVAAGGSAPGSAPGSGSVTLRRSRAIGAPQDLEPLAEAAAETAGEALLLSGGPGSPRCAVVELTEVEGSRGDGGELVELVIGFRSAGSAAAEGYRALARGCEPAPPGSIRRLGLLEEHRFFLRRDPRPPGAGGSHRLARIRFRPGSERVHPGSPRTGLALVDHAVDLQVALGFDFDGDGTIVEGSGAGRESDEWLYNDPRDRAPDPSRAEGRPGLIRSTLVLRSARPSRGPLSPRPARLEDREYDRSGPAPHLESRLFLRGSATATVRPRSG